MSSARRTLVWMSGLSVVTLLLSAVRELAIARELQASGEADFFFRGLVLVGTARAVALSLFRARWIPVGPSTSTWQLLREELRTAVLVTAGLLAALGAMLTPAEWHTATAWLFVAATILTVGGSAVRALAERAGREVRGFALEWAVPAGAAVGAFALGGGAFGPTLGLTLGLFAGALLLVPPLFAAPVLDGDQAERPRPPKASMRWLLVDTLVYVNLGLLDGALSEYVFPEGGLATLTYAYFFVNAALAVPTAALTVLSLRAAGRAGAASEGTLRRWALLAGIAVAALLSCLWGALGWSPISGLLDQAAGWSFAAAIRPIVLAGIPFAALRLANAVGRQYWVAHDPRRLVPWDVAGVVVRAVILVGLTPLWGVLTSPIGLALAELLQLFAWVRPRTESPT